MRDDLAKELEQIGLSENEAKVYLAGLELGPATAQQLAAKAIISRPNTYIMIESLIKRGLMSSYMKGKKKTYAAAAPNQLLYIVENRKRELFEQEKQIKKLMSELVGTQSEVGRRELRIYEGVEGIRGMQEDMLGTEDEYFFEITSLDDARKFVPPIFDGDLRHQFTKKYKFRTIYTNSKGPLEEVYKIDSQYTARQIDHHFFPIRGEVFICGNKVCLSSYEDKPRYVVIEDRQMSATFKVLFDALWNWAPIKK